MTDHCVLDYSRQPNRFQCLHCGAEKLVELPMPVALLARQAEDWTREHRRCKRNTTKENH